MLPPDATALRGRLGTSGRRFLTDAALRISLGDLADATSLVAADGDGETCDELTGASVLVATSDQLATVLTLIELDGVASRLVLCPPDLAQAHLPFVIATAGIDAVVVDRAAPVRDALRGPRRLICDPAGLMPRLTPSGPGRTQAPTEWVLFTSGTTSRPKMVLHDFASLAAPISSATAIEQGAVWSTFYDIRRYGGLTILLRALLDGGSMVLSDAAEKVDDFLLRAARDGVTHISGTPSHWRRALMSEAARRFAPNYVRLSGEVADQPLLDRLQAVFRGANVAHAFASTEAGVAFSIADGMEGFPARLLDEPGPVELRVEDGSLRIRSRRAALRYLGDDAPRLAGDDGFVDTGDMVELRGDRYRFVGRREGIINIGGLKVHPEEVEAVINTHEGVRMSRVFGRKSPITGAIVVADVVAAAAEGDSLRSDLLTLCRDRLARHKVPVAIRFVPSLDILPTGKLARRIA
jgi:acyl-CoA synthetase (AMP-forming)/AMP-acid ligase II